MKETPSNIAEWAGEAKGALATAWMLLKGEHPSLDDEHKCYLFKYGAALCSLNRGIKDKVKQKEIYQFSAKRVLAGFEEDATTREHYELNFYLAYIDSHIGLKLLTEAEAEEIMMFLASDDNSDPSNNH